MLGNRNWCITSVITEPGRVIIYFLNHAQDRLRVHHFGTPGMAINLWGVSPLYEFEGLKVGSIPTVTPIDKVLEEGNCGEVTNRGEEACECLVRKCHHLHSLQSCEATNRNVIQGQRLEWDTEINKPASKEKESLLIWLSMTTFFRWLIQSRSKAMQSS